MNIFITSPDPVECATDLDDKRLVKMILESVQMLSTAIARHGGTPVYKVAWKKHPCTIWTGDSRENFEWHLALLKAMNDEFVGRYNKHHKAFLVGYEPLKAQSGIVPRIGLTSFPNCSLRKDVMDVHQAYKLGFIEKWTKDKRPPRWTGKQIPAWAQAMGFSNER